jgi:opacity protein-like surface antigen
MTTFHRTVGRGTFVAVACLAALSLPAFAQGRPMAEQEHIVQVGFGGGVTVPLSDARDAFKDGVNGTGFVLVHLPSLPALRFALSYDRFKLKPVGTLTPSAGEDEPGHSQILGGTVGLKIHLLPGPVRPFVMAGLGAFNVQQVANLASGSTTTSDTNFGVDGGAGVEIKLGRISAFAEGRIQNVYTKNSGFVDKSSIQSVPVSFGVMF